MKTKHEQSAYKRKRLHERGNALIYVLIAIALFAALSFVLARQTDTSEAGSLSAERAELYATQLISYAAQAKSVYDQMHMSGARIDQIDFTLPTNAAFETEPPANIYKIYHPSGGGLIRGSIPDDAQHEINPGTPSNWYIGRFNNVEWTPDDSAGNPVNDIILTAHQIHVDVCKNINHKITGNDLIPVLDGNLGEYLIDASTNTDLTTAACPDCGKNFSLCVANSGSTAYSFYSIIADQ